MTDVCLIVKLAALAGKEHELRKELRAMLEPTRAEDGCKIYQLYESEKGKLFYFYEIWSSKEALDKHTKTPHYLHLQEVKGGLVKTGELSFVDEVH
jgi:quinol monooxygenase YgiN